MVQLVSPRLIRGLTVQRASHVVNNDISTAAHVQALNAAMATPGLEAFIFDRPYNITTRAVSSGTRLFAVPSGLTVVGNPQNKIDLSPAGNSGQVKYLFSADGTAGTSYALTANVSKGATTLTIGAAAIAAAGIARGDRVLLTSDRLFIAGGTVGAEECGEIITVMSTSGDNITFLPPAQDSYTTAFAAKVQKLTMATGIRMEGLAAIGPGQFTTDTVGDRMFHMIWCDNLLVDGCTSDYMDNGNYFYSCVDSRIVNFRATFQPQNARNSNQYGIAIVNACQDLIVDSAFINGGKHGIVQTESSIARGVTRRCKIKNSSVFGAWNFGIATHTNAEQLIVEGNYVQGCNGGIEAGTRDVTTRNNEIRFLPDANIGVGIGVTDIAENVTSIGDRVYGGRWGFRLNTTAFPLFSGSVGPFEITVKDFYAEKFSQDGIQILSALAGPFFNIQMENIRTYQAGETAAGITAAPSIEVTGPFRRLRIDGANLHAASTNNSACIVTNGINGARVSNVNYINHAAPSLSGTDIVTSNVSSF